jgi:aspartokinase/homoserine dehydrogenase 1
MSAVLAERTVAPCAQTADTALILLGTGGVGRALLGLLATPAAARLQLVGAANSRAQWIATGAAPECWIDDVLQRAGARRDDSTLLGILDRCAARRVIVDATASPEIASRHGPWLAAGYHVVTANKAAAGGSLHGWCTLQADRQRGNSHYGDAATVGAGLPVLSTLRRLRACGDELVQLEGVFSGSLSWLFSHYDDRRPFSSLLREARGLGYTEPDPRVDLAGTDVARKLLILARAAGFALDADAICVENLVPSALRDVDSADFMQRADELDAVLLDRLVAASNAGDVLRHIARLDRHGNARVGLVGVPSDHPATQLLGTDNQFAITTTRYPTRPLVIQGPGAGVEVTAQALLADILAVM